jgi:selenocysteine lyase/cysteine desulfurase
VIADNPVNYVAQSGIYLLSHSVGLPLKNAMAHVTKGFYEPWMAGNEDIWPNWLVGIEGFRSELGKLFNSDAANFCPQTNVSGAVTKLLYSLPRREDKLTILLSEEDFPSVAFTLGKAESSGFRLKFIPVEEDTLDISVWDNYLTSEVGLVLVTHVQSNNGKQLPVTKINAVARQRDILSLVDIAQSAGVVPIDFQQWQPDFVVGSCVKWISGGPGAAFLWVDPDVILQCKPVDVGWFSHEAPFEFDIHNFRYAEGVLRFWGGTPSVLPFLVAAHSLATVNNTGIDEIRAHNVQLTQQIMDNIEPQHLVSPANEAERGGTLVLNFGERQQAVEDRLRSANVHFDTRATGIRLGPHIYNTVEQIDLLVANIL